MSRIFAQILVSIALYPSLALAEAGAFLKANAIDEISRHDLRQILEDRGQDDIQLKNGIRYYQVQYLTTGVKGEETEASGLVMVPDHFANGPLPVLSYQHATMVQRSEAPSTEHDSDEVLAVAALFAGQGYAVVLPDGLGLGLSKYPYQPYLHADTEASSALDFIKATRVFFANEHVSLTGELFLAGYSQGGHWTLALHRAIDANPVSGYRILAAAEGAAPGDLSNSTFMHSILRPGRFSGVFSGALFYAYFNIYGNLAAKFDEAITQPYADRLPVIFSGEHTSTYAYRKLPSRPTDLFTEAYLGDVLSNANHPLRAALRANDLYAWKPLEPVFLIHSQSDDVVPYHDSEIILDSFLSGGAMAKLIPIPGKLNHLDAFLPAMAIAAANFHPFLNQTRTLGSQATNRVLEAAASR